MILFKEIYSEMSEESVWREEREKEREYVFLWERQI